LEYSAAAVTSWLTDVTYGNRFPQSGLSVFGWNPGDLAFVMVHENEHVQQVAGRTPFNRRAMIRAYYRNAAFRSRIEAEANQLACANVTDMVAYSVFCR
jgi:hypothetical protein